MFAMNIQKSLHHRHPYLLIQEVIQHSQERLVARSTFQGKEFFLQGHFPGMPVVPGAMMQEMTTQAAGLLLTNYHSPVPDYDSEITKGWALGVLRAVHGARYRNFARPGDELEIVIELLDSLENSFRFKGKIQSLGKTIMTNEFTLVNIPDDQLRGAPSQDLR